MVSNRSWATWLWHKQLWKPKAGCGPPQSGHAAAGSVDTLCNCCVAAFQTTHQLQRVKKHSFTWTTLGYSAAHNIAEISLMFSAFEFACEINEHIKHPAGRSKDKALLLEWIHCWNWFPCIAALLCFTANDQSLVQRSQTRLKCCPRAIWSTQDTSYLIVPVSGYKVGKESTHPNMQGDATATKLLLPCHVAPGDLQLSRYSFLSIVCNAEVFHCLLCNAIPFPKIKPALMPAFSPAHESDLCPSSTRCHRVCQDSGISLSQNTLLCQSHLHTWSCSWARRVWSNGG